MTRKFIIRLQALVIPLSVASLVTTCSPHQSGEPAEFKAATRIALDWNRMLLDLEWHTSGYRSPVTARMFAYAEMAAYEAALPAMDGYLSMENKLPGYQQPGGVPKNYYLPAALNAAFAQIARAFFPTAPYELKQKIESLELDKSRSFSNSLEAASMQASVDFGRRAAHAVWNYSTSDTLGHDGFIYNYDRSFKLKENPGAWKPVEERPMPALLPYWGNIRPFLVRPAEIKIKAPIVFDASTSSAFYAEAMEVYSISKSISGEERWIAEFWGDDIPSLTISPAGRWISIANQAIEKAAPSFPKTMEAYLRLSMSMCDATIICWKAKYEFQLERPESFIQKNIEPNWSPLHKSPPFPAYPSGHASIGAAAAEILTSFFGTDFKMTDRTHINRKEFQSKPRSFNSFYEMAQENAYSRLLNGVHYRMDCEEGLRLGKMVGQKILREVIQKEAVSSVKDRIGDVGIKR